MSEVCFVRMTSGREWKVGHNAMKLRKRIEEKQERLENPEIQEVSLMQVATGPDRPFPTLHLSVDEISSIRPAVE